MKKGFEKFLAISTGVINLFFLTLIGLIIFKRIDVALFDNQLVVTLLSVLGAINIVLIGFAITNSFIDREALSAIMLFSDKTSSTRASMNVVKSIVRRSAKQLGSVRVGKIALFLEENNGLRMRVAIKVKENQLEDAVDKFRCLLIDEFLGILDVEFNSIDFKVTTLKTNYKADMSKVEDEALKLKMERAEKHAQQKDKLNREEDKKKAKTQVDMTAVKKIIVPADEPFELTEEGTLQENKNPDFEEGLKVNEELNTILDNEHGTLDENKDEYFEEGINKEDENSLDSIELSEEIDNLDSFPAELSEEIQSDITENIMPSKKDK